MVIDSVRAGATLSACHAAAQARRTGRGLRKNVDLFYATTGLTVRK